MRMKPLSNRDDPTGFLSLFRLASMDRFGDPSGNIQGRGRWHHGKKRGPGRRNSGSRNPAGSKLWNKCPEKRSFEVFDSTSGE